MKTRPGLGAALRRCVDVLGSITAMLLACRFDGAYSPAASFCVQWHEGGGVSNNDPNFAWSCPGYLARVMPRILRVVGLGKAAWGRGFWGW